MNTLKPILIVLVLQWYQKVSSGKVNVELDWKFIDVGFGDRYPCPHYIEILLKFHNSSRTTSLITSRSDLCCLDSKNLFYNLSNPVIIRPPGGKVNEWNLNISAYSLVPTIRPASFSVLMDSISKTWKSIKINGDTMNGLLLVRYVCTKHYYGVSCNVSCRPIPDRFVCDPVTGRKQCLRGWRGSECDVKIHCLGNNCHRGTCVEDTDSFYCLCDPYYTGSRCTIFDPCSHPVCPIGTICQVWSELFSCVCPRRGMKGKNCDEDIDECQHVDLCQNGGLCLNTIGSFRCLCSSGFNGSLCETSSNTIHLGETELVCTVPCPEACFCYRNKCFCNNDMGPITNAAIAVGVLCALLLACVLIVWLVQKKTRDQ